MPLSGACSQPEILPVETQHIRFVRAIASDGVPLDGIVFEPEGPAHGKILLVHGAGSHFYQRLHQVLGATLAAAGYRVLAGNNRGHDLGAYLPNDGPEVTLGGAAWERFEDAVLDLRAWVDLLATEAEVDLPLALIGHSLGAAKVAHYQAATQDARVAALVGCSGLGFGSRLMRRPGPPEERLAAVRQLVASGHGDQLLDSSYQRRYISAGTYLDRIDRLRAGAPVDLARISVPLLVVYATGEGGTPELLADIQAGATASPRCDTLLVADADHDYHGQEAAVGGELISWLSEVMPGQR
ncbi:MAG: alpha/beta hydrolase [Chloroflexota bacterium]